MVRKKIQKLRLKLKIFVLVASLLIIGLIPVMPASVAAATTCSPGTATAPSQPVGADGKTPAVGVSPDVCNPPPLPPPYSNCPNSGSPDLVGCYVTPIIDLLSGLVGIVCIASLIMGGIQYTTSAGDPQKAAKAKSRIINVVVAFVAFAFLFGFLQFIIPGGLFQK